MKKGVLLAVVGLLLSGHGVLAAQAFLPSDVEGDWYMFTTDVNPADPSVYWTQGLFEVDNTGQVVSGEYSDPQGNIYPVTSGRLQLDQAGVMSGSATIDMGGGNTATAVFPHGKLDQAKTKAAFVTMMSPASTPDDPADDSMSVGMGIKGGGTFSQADLAGTWYAYSTVIDLLNNMVFWAYGTFTADEAGSVTPEAASYRNPMGLSADVTGGSLTLDTDGIMGGTLGLTYELPPGNTVNMTSVLAGGKLDQSKSSGVFVAHDFNTGFEGDPANLISLEMTYLVKATDDEFNLGKVFGDRYAYGLGIVTQPPAEAAVYWMRGRFQIDSTGKTTGTWIFPNGDTLATTGGMLNVDPQGVITGRFPLANGDFLNIVNGKSDQSLTQGAFVSATDSGMLFIGVDIKNTYRFPWSAYLPAFMPKD